MKVETIAEVKANFEVGQVTAFEPTAIAAAVEAGGFGKSWVFWYFGKKDEAPRQRVATLHPPIGDKPTLVSGSHFVGYDPTAVDRKTGKVGGFRYFKFENMSELAPVQGVFEPTD